MLSDSWDISVAATIPGAMKPLMIGVVYNAGREEVDPTAAGHLTFEQLFRA